MPGLMVLTSLAVLFVISNPDGKAFPNIFNWCQGLILVNFSWIYHAARTRTDEELATYLGGAVCASPPLPGTLIV